MAISFAMGLNATQPFNSAGNEDEVESLREQIDTMVRHLNNPDNAVSGYGVVNDFRKLHGIDDNATIPDKLLTQLKTVLSNEMRECLCGPCFNKFVNE